MELYYDNPLSSINASVCTILLCAIAFKNLPPFPRRLGSKKLTRYREFLKIYKIIGNGNW